MHASKSHFHRYAVLTALLGSISVGGTSAAQAEQKFGFGQAATQEQIDAWNIDVFADGRNLPPGSGTIMAGQDIYTQQCVACHGAKGEGGIGDRLAGGQGSLASDKPIKTVGSFWPYAPTLYDYVRRTMPLMAPQSLTNDEVYAVVGYVLHLNGLVEKDATITAQFLADLKMPNRDGFIPDPRPDVGVSGQPVKAVAGVK
jgi:mono/diheme cytochrome c family protein